jgi:hypothetical protein
MAPSAASIKLPTLAELVVFGIADPTLEAEAVSTTAAAAQVHVVPAGAKPIRAEVADDLPWDGHYAPDLIRVHSGRPRRGLALLHELGHYLDDQCLPTTTSPASTGPELADWRRHVKESDATAALHQDALAADPCIQTHSRYLLRYSEAFARSYAQWVTLRSGSVDLLDELADAQAVLHYGQWGNDDFQTIATALDAYFGGLK